MSITGHSSESRERNPKNQQKDVESRCFLEEIPQYKECAIHKRLASTSQEEKLWSCCFKFQGFSAQAAICTSRIHPCLSDFLRLSPSVSLSFSLLLPPPPTPHPRLPVSLHGVSHRPSPSIPFLTPQICCHSSKPCNQLCCNYLFPAAGNLNKLNQMGIVQKRKLDK